MMTSAIDTDVLIVGAGPTGLMLANQLARRGIRAIVIDRHAGPARETRALGVQARTLEIYQHLGIVEQALARGERATGGNLWSHGRLAARIPLGDMGRGLSPFPFLLVLGQDENERLLGQHLGTLGMAVQWSTELVALAQEPDMVSATLRQGDGTTRQVTATWVAGCDGAHSAVRDFNGIPFEGAPYELVFFLADTVATGDMVPHELNIYLLRQGFHLLFPMRGKNHWRVIGILPTTLRERTDLTFEDVIPAVRQEAGATLDFSSCNWFSTYRIHHRCAAHFRDRRCFLLGDAAHVHSPVGAQGMNTGLQDAYNLGWKLALVVSGRAGAPLLESYEGERLPVARRLLETTDRAFSLIVSDSPLAGVVRTQVVARIAAMAMSRERVRRAAFRAISQIDIRYPDSPLSRSLPGLPRKSPRAGDRFPWLQLSLRPGGPVEDLFAALDDTRFTLLLFGLAPPPGAVVELGDLLRTHTIRSDSANDRELARARIPQPSFYLLRPDGHITLAGTRLEPGEIKAHLSSRLHLSS